MTQTHIAETPGGASAHDPPAAAGPSSKPARSTVSHSAGGVTLTSTCSCPFNEAFNTKRIFPIVDNCPNEPHTWAAVTAQLSRWIYLPAERTIAVTNQLAFPISVELREPNKTK